MTKRQEKSSPAVRAEAGAGGRNRRKDNACARLVPWPNALRWGDRARAETRTRPEKLRLTFFRLRTTNPDPTTFLPNDIASVASVQGSFGSPIFIGLLKPTVFARVSCP